MTVSKRTASWLYPLGALILVAAPAQAPAQEAAPAVGAPAAAVRPTPAASALDPQPAAGAAAAIRAQEPTSARPAPAARTLGPRPAAGAQGRAATPRPTGAQRAPAAQRPSGDARAAGAQRAPGARERRAVRRTPRPVIQTRAWYGPGFGYYDPFYSPYFYGAGWGLHPWGPWGGYPLYGGYYRERGSVRLQVKPVETEVYVDGYYAGVVDSYDGFFQRLSLPPGRHDIELRLEGYRSIAEQIYLAVGQSYRIEHQMEPLGPGETTPPPPTPQAEPEVDPGVEPDPFAPPEPAPAPALAPAAGFGQLVVQVRPADAAIFIDGEEWYSPASSRLELEVGAGRHRIEVRREGYESYVTDVTVQAGEAATVNIALPRNRPAAPDAPPPGA